MDGKYIIIPEHFTTDEANEFRKNLIDLINKGEINFVMDFGQCTFIDVTGLGVLIFLNTQCNKRNGSLKLCYINNITVMEIFKLTRLDKLFKINN